MQKRYVLYSLRYFSRGSNNSDNIGHTPLLPKYEKTFLNLEYGDLVTTNDLQSKIYKRNRKLNLFKEVYQPYFQNYEVTILGLVVDVNEYPKISKFLNSLSKKLQRKGIDKLGYVWVRDIGDKKFERHFHLLLATSRISKDTFKSLFEKKKSNAFSCILINAVGGMKNYLIKKDLYGGKNQRSYGSSKQFKSPISSKKAN